MKFSIIVPVYNVAAYLDECLRSISVQSFSDWEAICVDDGSTDASGAFPSQGISPLKRQMETICGLWMATML